MGLSGTIASATWRALVHLRRAAWIAALIRSISGLDFRIVGGSLEKGTDWVSSTLGVAESSSDRTHARIVNPTTTVTEGS